MEKLFQLLKLDAPTKGSFGIEIECEGHDMRAIRNDVWRSEDDGSLRGVYPQTRSEFVLVKPIPLDEVEKAIDSLIKSQRGATFNFSFRTSVHIHMNVQELTYVQLLNLIYTYFLLEEPLMNWCGDERKGNRFCLRLRDAEYMMKHIVPMFSHGYDHLQGVEHDSIRYSSLNLEAFKKYGSVEFRGMRGNMDKQVIVSWVNMLNSLKEYASKMASPKEIHDDYRKIGSIKFLKKVLGENAKLVTTDTTSSEMAQSYSISLDLPFSYKEPVKAAPKKARPMYAQVMPVAGDWAAPQMVNIDEMMEDARERQRRAHEEIVAHRQRNAALGIQGNPFDIRPAVAPRVRPAPARIRFD